jgi:AraC-like DNA-binding protein
MRELTDILQKRILPTLRSGAGRILTPGETPFLEVVADSQAHFIEAYQPQHHPFFEMMWMLRGTAHLKVEGQIYETTAGDLSFLPPFIAHADVYERRTAEYESLWFSHSPGSLAVSHFYYKPFGHTKGRVIARLAAEKEIMGMFFALQREGLRRDSYSEEATRAFLFQFAILILRTVENQPEESPAAGELSIRVRRYLEQNYAKQVTLESIAKSLELSPNYIATVFKKETGQTILETLTAIRMARAVPLLLQDNLPVAAVAKAVGYGSAEHFSRTFSRLKGVAPTRYGRKEGSGRNVMKAED